MRNAKILVVEDEEGLRVSIGIMLQHHGFVVELAPNVPEALAAIDALTFDVLLSDLQMPGPGDGLTVVRAMQHKNPKAVTLLMSGNMDRNAVGTTLAPDEMLNKPLQMREVVQLIHQKLGTA